MKVKVDNVDDSDDNDRDQTLKMIVVMVVVLTMMTTVTLIMMIVCIKRGYKCVDSSFNQKKKKVSVSFCFNTTFKYYLKTQIFVTNGKDARPENEFYHLPKHFQGKYIVLGPL